MVASPVGPYIHQDRYSRPTKREHPTDSHPTCFRRCFWLCRKNHLLSKQSRSYCGSGQRAMPGYMYLCESKKVHRRAFCFCALMVHQSSRRVRAQKEHWTPMLFKRRVPMALAILSTRSKCFASSSNTVVQSTKNGRNLCCTSIH